MMDTVSNMGGSFLANTLAFISFLIFKSSVGLINSFVQECIVVKVHWQHSNHAFKIMGKRAKILGSLTFLAGVIYVVNWYFGISLMIIGRYIKTYYSFIS